MSDKDNKFKKESWSPPKEEEKVPVIKDKPFTGKLNDPNVPMRRKGKICRDGKDWFDTHPDA